MAPTNPEQYDRDNLVASMNEILVTLHAIREHTDVIMAVISVALEQHADDLDVLLQACRAAQKELQKMGFYGRPDHPSVHEQLAIAFCEVLTPPSKSTP